jgi:hypothetical protein
VDDETIVDEALDGLADGRGADAEGAGEGGFLEAVTGVEGSLADLLEDEALDAVAEVGMAGWSGGAGDGRSGGEGLTGGMEHEGGEVEGHGWAGLPDSFEKMRRVVWVRLDAGEWFVKRGVRAGAAGFRGGSDQGPAW